MGTWSTSSFGNDRAVDWTFGLKGEASLDYVTQAIDSVLNAPQGDLIDANAAVEAIAAAEVIARLGGHPGVQDAYSKPVDEWVRSNPQAVPKALRERARQALARVTDEGSELRELWDESGDLEGWLDEVKDLAGRL